MKVFRLALLVALALTLLLTSSTLAHAKFVKSEPAPDAVLSGAPQQVTIWFSEELDTRKSVIKVFNAAGTQVDEGNTKVNLDDRKQMAVGLKQPLANGVYTVKWQNLSAEDNEEDAGEFKFTLRIATPPTVPAYPPPTTVASPTPTVAPSATTVTSPTPQSTATAAPTTAPTTALPRVVTQPALPVATPTPTPPAATTSADLTLPLMILSVIVLGAGTILVLRRR